MSMERPKGTCLFEITLLDILFEGADDTARAASMLEREKINK
jgi:hypothetical protein